MTPTLRMLWELDDPRVVLAERFGFDDAAAVVAWVSDVLGRHWGEHVEDCTEVVMSDRNALAWVTTDRGARIAKWSVAPEGFARLDAVARLTARLHARGLPVSAPVPTRDGRAQLATEGASIGLQRVLAGSLLDVGDPRQVRSAGVVLARLHLALAEHPREPALVEGDHPRSVQRWVEAALASAGALDVVPAHADGLDGLPRQLLHGDVRSANLLCSGSKVTAVLDFEEVRSAPAIDELARASVLLGTRFHAWGPVSPGVRADFRVGYEAVRPLTPTESAWCDVLVLAHGLAMVPLGADPTGWGPAAQAQLASLRAQPG